MLDWWQEIAKHTQAALVTQVVNGTNLNSSSSIVRPGVKSPVFANAAPIHQGPLPPYERLNEKAEMPNNPVMGHAVPAGGAVATAAAAAAPVATTTTATTTTNNGAHPLTTAGTSAPDMNFLPEKAPVQDQHPMKRQNTGSTVSLHTSELVL